MRLVLFLLISLNRNTCWVCVCRKYRVSLTVYGGAEVAFWSLRVDYLTVKIVAYVFQFSLTADLAISKYVSNDATIGANQTTFVGRTVDLW
jgi:hypothetical protein